MIFRSWPCRYSRDNLITAVRDVVRFVIRKVSERTLSSEKPVAHANTGMVGEAGFDTDTADRKLHLLQLFDLKVCGQFAERNRKERVFHLAGKHGAQAMPRAFITENTQAVLRFVNRLKKRQALNVIPMRVRQQHRQVQWLFFEFLHQLFAQKAKTCAGVQNDQFTLRADFYTGGVAAVFDSSSAR